MKIALITGASMGLGRALSEGLAADGWGLVIDARTPGPLHEAAQDLRRLTQVVALPGDIADPQHRAALIEAAAGLGGLDLLVNNAGILGPSPQPRLEAYPLDVLANVYAVNVIAQLGLVQAALPLLEARRGRILNVTSDAAVEPYPGWGGYGSAKAAFEQLSAVLAAEHPDLRVWWVDPGDMRTRMHQDAFPGEDISDRPLPEDAVPTLVELIGSEVASGRYRVEELVRS
jgi:NAD(P)-dependent dehydrogenase (short-subunit alcohol dehydrogenase family)